MENKMKIIIDAITNTKGENILVYDFTQLNPYIDRVIICSANNIRQVYAIASNVKEKCKENNYEARIEGNQNSRWILIDLKDIIVHVFLDEERDIYRLERLYDDLPRLEKNYNV